MEREPEPTPVPEDAAPEDAAPEDAAPEDTASEPALEHRPHAPGEALALLALGVLLFWGTTWLAEAPVRFLAEIAPALGVLALVLPAYVLISRRGRDPFVAHGVLIRPRHLGSALALSLLILVLYGVAFAVFAGGGPKAPVPWEKVVTRFLHDLVFVALAEEYLFRGVLQPSLDRLQGPRWRLLGAPFGRGAVLAAALFALTHVILDPSLYRAAVFFPALWFAWLRSRTQSVLPGVLAHALANTLEVACLSAWMI